MTDSITVTREQVERTMLEWLKTDEAYCFDNDDFRCELTQSFTTALFNNVKVGAVLHPDRENWTNHATHVNPITSCHLCFNVVKVGEEGEK